MKKELLIPVILLGLFGAFFAVSFLTWAARGNGRLVAMKLGLGAMILSITGAATGCNPVVTCYDQASPSESETAASTNDPAENVNAGDSETGSEKPKVAEFEEVVRPPPRRVTCYAPRLRGNIFSFSIDDDDGTIHVNVKNDDTVRGKLLSCQGTAYSFSLHDQSSNKEMQRGSVHAVDGKFDLGADEEIEIKLTQDLPAGEYLLNTYNVAEKDIKPDMPRYMVFPLKIVDE